jgi:hypothetical protein
MRTTREHEPPDRPERADGLSGISDPVERLLLTGAATTVFEAEERYLDEAFEEVLRLLRSPLSDEELGNHPLMVLFRSYGSPAREDSLV